MDNLSIDETVFADKKAKKKKTAGRKKKLHKYNVDAAIKVIHSSSPEDLGIIGWKKPELLKFFETKKKERLALNFNCTDEAKKKKRDIELMLDSKIKELLKGEKFKNLYEVEEKKEYKKSPYASGAIKLPNMIIRELKKLSKILNVKSPAKVIAELLNTLYKTPSHFLNESQVKGYNKTIGIKKKLRMSKFTKPR